MNGETIQTPEGPIFLDMGKETFRCPKCGQRHDADDWYDKYAKRAEPKNGFVISIKCKGCRVMLQLTVGMMGEVAVWLPGEANTGKQIPA